MPCKKYKNIQETYQDGKDTENFMKRQIVNGIVMFKRESKSFIAVLKYLKN